MRELLWQLWAGHGFSTSAILRHLSLSRELKNGKVATSQWSNLAFPPLFAFAEAKNPNFDMQ